MYGSPLSLRRLRQSALVRGMVREVRFSHEQFIQPLFVVEGIKEPESIHGLNEVMRETSDSLVRRVEQDIKRGAQRFLLFGVPKVKSAKDFNFDFVSAQIARLKREFGENIWLAADVCLCAFTDHGHCGVLSDSMDHVSNPESTAELARQALEYAQAGANCVAPSDMMDGRVLAMRNILRDHGLDQTLIMSYSAKFSSKFYGPFRLACDSKPNVSLRLKDRTTYQIDPFHPSDAFRSSQRDVEEGADILMVKPAMLYLDVLSELSQQIPLPWAAYQVSGEYAAIELLAKEGLADRKLAHYEVWGSMVRAGTSMIISYASRHVKEWLSEIES